MIDRQEKLTHLDLCTGIGGFHLAAEWAGFETVGFSEIDSYCCKLLAEKWPEIPNYGDIRTANFSGLRGRVDVLSARVPCQPSSFAGRRRGSRDDRWLWEAVLDVVGAVEPAWAIFENPPGILSLDSFGGVLLRLGTLEYQVRAFSVPANAVGAKHRRQRVFIVANRNVERLEGSEYVGQRNGIHEQSLDLGGEALADAAGQRCREERQLCARSETRSAECGEALADTNGSGWSEQRWPEPVGAEFERNGWRQSESGICGVGDGLCGWLDGAPMPDPLTKERIPDRSHRLKALGNAVVPQQAYPFFAAIARTEISFV